MGSTPIINAKTAKMQRASNHPKHGFCYHSKQSYIADYDARHEVATTNLIYVRSGGKRIQKINDD